MANRRLTFIALSVSDLDESAVFYRKLLGVPLLDESHEWMQSLFGPDLPKTMSLSWIMERVQRCESQIWATASQILREGGRVVLDLGFTKIESRRNFRRLAEALGSDVHLHVLDAPYAVRKERVMKRNLDRGETFSFEVTPMMFDFMEKEFQSPTEEELSHARIV